MKVAELFEVKKDAGPVGVPNPSPDAKKNRKMAQAVVAGYTNHIKTSGFNQSYAKKHRKEMSEAKETPAHLMKTASSKAEKVNGYADFKSAMIAIGGTKKVANDEGKTYCSKDGKIVGKWDPIMSMGYIYKPAINEGMWVVKSKDGVEKRFKDDSSPEAKAWKNSAQKKPPKLAVYSDAYWEKKDKESDDYDFVTPWKKITGNSDGDQIERLVKDQHGAGKTDWTIGKASEQTREGTTCATCVVRIMFEYGPEDDMGVDEPTSDSQSILVARNPKKPKQIDFVKYTN